MAKATKTATKATTKEKKPRSPRYVYDFEQGNRDMKDLLGGKGANLGEMTNLGLPVPPGFTITTEACNAYYASGKKFPDGMWEQAIEALHHVEEKTGKKLGDVQNPLLVSVRSGAKLLERVIRERLAALFEDDVFEFFDQLLEMLGL